MKAEIIYVELKSGFSDNGPAWIGKGFYTSSRKTVYFNGQVFKRVKGIAGNHFDQQNGDEYWISGVKKDGTDRHWAGGGKIILDQQSVDEYLKVINEKELPKNKFNIEELIQAPNKALAVELENEKLQPEFDEAIRFKNLADLTDQELEALQDYYDGLDLPAHYKKARKEFINSKNDMEKEIEKRAQILMEIAKRQFS
jgi:hypothetical protein